MRRFADRLLVAALVVGAIAVLFASVTVVLVALAVGIVAYAAEYAATEDSDADR